jgi:hypothetical protein
MTLEIEYGGGNTDQDFIAFTNASSPTDTGGTKFEGVVDTLAELQAFVAQ